MQRIILIIAFTVSLSGCSGNWGWYVVDPTTDGGIINLKFLLSGLYYTILTSLVAIFISIVIGLIVALPA